MGMSAYYTSDKTPEEQEKANMEVLTRAADLGITFWDTSDMYGPFTNEELLGRWFKATGRRNEIFLATKFGVTWDMITKTRTVKGDKAYVKQACEGSLKRLGVGHIDLYYQHRVDYNTKIEETIEAMAELSKEGKIRYLGMSECSAKTLKRALKVHQIHAVQLEYSLFALEIEREEVGLKKVCEENNVAIVCYSPLGRGLLTGEIKSRADLQKDDLRLMFPRFSEENFKYNLQLVDKVKAIADKRGATPGQVSIAWLIAQGPNVMPIPGTKRINIIEENAGALKIELTSEELKEIREAAEKAEVKGERYPPQMSFNPYELDTI